MSDEQPEKQPKEPLLRQQRMEAYRKRRKELEKKRELLFTFGDDDQYSVIKAECSCRQEFSYIKEDIEEPPTGRFKSKVKFRTVWHTLCKGCLDKFEMRKRLREYLQEGDYTIVEKQCKDCEELFWYIRRKSVGDVISPEYFHRPGFKKLCQTCSEKFRGADYEDDDDDDWWKGK